MLIKNMVRASLFIVYSSSSLFAGRYIEKAIFAPIAGSCGYVLGGIMGDGLDARYNEADALEKINHAVGNGSFDVYRKNIEKLLLERDARPQSALEAFFLLRKDAPYIQHYAYTASFVAAASFNAVGLVSWSLALAALNAHKIVDTEEYLAYLSKRIEASGKKP